MSWLTQSFAAHSIAWILLSSIVGGFVGASIKFLFEDVLKPRWGWRRRTAQIVRQYSTPLVRSAEALERRINIIVRNVDEQWFRTDEYFQLSTLFQFGEYLAWVRILERKFGFLPFESEKRGAEFNRRLNGFFRAVTSHRYFRADRTIDEKTLESSEVPRLMLTAIGEAMTGVKKPIAPLTFTEFCRRYGRRKQFQRWFEELSAFIRAAHPKSAPLEWDRLIAAGANLRALIVFLDARGGLVERRAPANLEKLQHPVVRAALEKDFGDLDALFPAQTPVSPGQP